VALDATRATLGAVTVTGGTLSVRGARRDPRLVRIGAEPVLVGRNPSCHLVVDDGGVSAVHAEFVATDRGVRTRDLGSRNGTWIGEARIVEAYLTGRTSVWLGDVELRFECEAPRRVAPGKTRSMGGMLGATPAMRAVFDRIERVAASDLTVLIQGETGTGKELAATMLHEQSGRRGPLVVVDCGAIPASLAESVLFGHERGAFTGAHEARASPFVEAKGGTVFLDELGELPVELQPKLLRVLAERRIKAVGAAAYRSVDVRVVAATRRDLLRAVNDGSFRADLYFRVAQMRLELPPLRERAADIPLLVRSMLAARGVEHADRRVSGPCMERLMRHDWPGNVRELESAVAAAVATGDERGPLDIASHLTSLQGDKASRHPSGESFHEAKRAALDRFEREYFAPLVAAAGGKIAEVARLARLERAHVRRYLARHGLSPRARKR
jgi:DNA-binding NtrC family response regulator